MLPAGSTFRSNRLPESPMYRSPVESTAIPVGVLIEAVVAGIPSAGDVPPPATVVILRLEILRIRLLPESETKRLPLESKARASGLQSRASLGSPPSPEKPHPPGVPANVLIMPFETSRMMQFCCSAINRLPDVSTAIPVGPYNSALVALPPSPEEPGVPVPARVEMTPPAGTLRTALPHETAMLAVS